jgi:hypothetical protein
MFAFDYEKMDHLDSTERSRQAAVTGESGVMCLETALHIFDACTASICALEPNT